MEDSELIQKPRLRTGAGEHHRPENRVSTSAKEIETPDLAFFRDAVAPAKLRNDGAPAKAGEEGSKGTLKRPFSARLRIPSKQRKEREGSGMPGTERRGEAAIEGRRVIYRAAAFLAISLDGRRSRRRGSRGPSG